MDDGVFNAVIRGADIFLAGSESGVLGFSLTVDYGGMCQEFSVVPLAHMDLETKGDRLSSEAPYLTSYVLMQTLRVADVKRWRELVGKPVVVVVENGFILEIRHFLKPEISLNVRRYLAQHSKVPDEIPNREKWVDMS